jgi:hypothetical protein
MSLTNAQIGRAGEILVQYRLLLLGIESAPMTTDAGVDLVAYSPKTKAPRTVQVKTSLGPRPAGGRGSLALDWWVPDDSPAQLVALVDLSEPRLWLFKLDELWFLAQQHSNGRHHICMYADENARPRNNRLAHVHEFQCYLLENRARRVFRV